MRILVAEDEKDLNRIIVKRLQKEGYCVDSCLDGEEALVCLETGEFDTAIMDIMMPGRSGLDVLRSIRSRGISTPVLLLTAKDTVKDKVEGLDLGADDYMIKPFAFDELLARVRVMMRKAVGGLQNQFTVGDLVLDGKRRTVLRAGKEIVLSAREFDILEYLVRNKSVVLSREKIENHVWGLEYSGGTNIVDVYIRYLRKKVDEGFSGKLIHTIRGVGYVVRCDL